MRYSRNGIRFPKNGSSTTKAILSCICLVLSLTLIAPMASGKAVAFEEYCYVNCVWDVEFDVWRCMDVCKTIPTTDCCIVPLIAGECAEDYHCWWIVGQ